MSELAKMENPNILYSSPKSKSVPSLLLSSSNKNKKDISKTINSTINTNNPFERLRLIEETISNRNSELKKIKYKLAEIKLREKLIEKGKYALSEESLPLMKKQEIMEDNKIKSKLTIQNSFLNNKLKLLTEKVNKIEAELLYGSRKGFLSSLKDKLKEILNKKEVLISKINENNDEIQKINEKDIKNKYKFNKKIFLENLDNGIGSITPISRNKNFKLNHFKKYFLSEGDIINNSNKEYHKKLYEEEKNKRIIEQKFKEQKYKEMREEEIKTVQNRKKSHFNFHKEIMSRNWINNLSNKKNYLSWEFKEKERIKQEENLILLSNQKKSLIYQPISSEELNEFSNKVKKEEIKTKNNLKIKKKMLEELWKERKDKLPKQKSTFLLYNIQNEKKIKEDLILKKEIIKGNMFERLNFSSEVAKRFRPKLIDEKMKKERIKKIMELDGINKQQDIKELNNRLKLKLNKVVNTQPKNFRKNNIFETSKSVFEQQIMKLQKYKNLEISAEEQNNKKNNNNGKNINLYQPENIKYKSINKSIEYSDIYQNKERKRNINNNFLNQYYKEKSFNKYVKEIQAKIKLLNQLVE